jgi:putative NADH-flavin reductase
MRIALFGATGRTGQHLLDQALSAGYEVTVLVRDPAKLKTKSEHLHVVAGSVLDAAQVEQAVTGAGCVISVLGPVQNKPTYEISTGIDHIIAAMKKQGVRRLIISAGAGVRDPNDSPGPFDSFIQFLVKTLSRYVYEDMVQVVSNVRASDLDWTIVRVPMLTDGPRTGKIQASYVGKGMGPRISRADLAEFMLSQVTDEAYLHKAPAISSAAPGK